MDKSAAAPTLDQLRLVAGRLGPTLGCRLIVLFGSAARGQGRPPEDLDLAVLGQGPLDAVELTNRFIRALAYQQVDVTDLTRADPLLLMLVAREGVPLYEAAPGELARFASLAARRYADTRKFREMERREIQDFVTRRRGTS